MGDWACLRWSCRPLQRFAGAAAPAAGVPMRSAHGTPRPAPSAPLCTRSIWQLEAPNVARAALSFSSALRTIESLDTS